MTPLEKVARAIIRGTHEKCCTGAALDDIANLPLNDTDIRAARAAIDALADAVSDEMCKRVADTSNGVVDEFDVKWACRAMFKEMGQ